MQRDLSQHDWAAAVSHKHQASAFFIGRFMHQRDRFRLKELLQLLAAQLALIIEENWGWVSPERA